MVTEIPAGMKVYGSLKIIRGLEAELIMYAGHPESEDALLAEKVTDATKALRAGHSIEREEGVREFISVSVVYERDEERDSYFPKFHPDDGDRVRVKRSHVTIKDGERTEKVLGHSWRSAKILDD